MNIIQIISEHKKIKGHWTYDKEGKRKDFISAVQPRRGMKRVEAIGEHRGVLSTMHIDVPKETT